MFESSQNLPSAEDIRSIGEIIKDTRNLSVDQVTEVLRYQQEHDLKFGEAAVALGYASREDVLYALSRQFNYPYGNPKHRNTSTELVMLNYPFSPQAEVIRSIRTEALIRRGDNLQDKSVFPRAIAVVSPNQGDGKTYVAANLAIALAQMGQRTLLIDADLRNPRQHQVFQVSNQSGLSSMLSNRRGAQSLSTVPDVPNLYVLASGTCPPNPLELLESNIFGLVLQEVHDKFAHVVVDTSASIMGADNIVTAGRCGAAILVGRKNVTRHADFDRIIKSLNAVEAKILGVVLNDA